MQKILMRAVAGAAMFIASTSVNAATYIIDVASSIGNGTATLTTAGDASSTLSLVTALTGTFNGQPITLLPGGTSPLFNDNLFRAVFPHFDLSGLGFTDGANYYKLLNNGTFDLIYSCSAAGCVPASNLTTANITVHADTPAVPEPATWALMLFGFAAVGLTVRRRKLVLVSRQAV